ncbi:tetratricopeptide repeat protein [Candidatus Sumerlaeota bacterium]|nr:tetratricopeptide repeat protein [Candidatus Sumerlaeota bacterium]
MFCPYCKTENRDEWPSCYHCNADLTLLRSVVVKSRQHFNAALEHTERGRNKEAIAQLKTALELDSTFVGAWVVLGTIYAKEERFAEAEAAWRKALALNPQYEKCANYLMQARRISEELPALKNMRRIAAVLSMLVAVLGIALIGAVAPGVLSRIFGGGLTRGTIAALLLLFPLLFGVVVRLYVQMPRILEYLSSIFRDRD